MCVVCVCVALRVYARVCVFCVCIPARVCECMGVCVSVGMCVCMCVCVCVRASARARKDHYRQFSALSSLNPNSNYLNCSLEGKAKTLSDVDMQALSSL